MSPKTKEQFEEIRTKRQQSIMDVALALFAKNGFHSTSISQIAKEAGVSKGLMYNYFESKEDLLKGILMAAYEEGTEVMTEELKLPDTPKAHLLNVIVGFEGMLKKRFTFWKLMTALSFQEDVHKLINAEIMPKKEDLIEQFVDLFKQMGFENPKMEAYLMGAMLDGIALHYMTLEAAYPLEEMITLVKKRYNLITN